MIRMRCFFSQKSKTKLKKYKLDCADIQDFMVFTTHLGRKKSATCLF